MGHGGAAADWGTGPVAAGVEGAQLALQPLHPSTDPERLQARYSELRRVLDLTQRSAAVHQQQVCDEAWRVWVGVTRARAGDGRAGGP